MSPAHSPQISIIVPTYNRCRLLRDVLESLLQQTLPPGDFEVIVVDNCSNDGTEEMVLGYVERAPFRLRYHRMPQNRGVVLSRNTGARLAEGPVFGFTDSDCAVSPEWIATALETFKAHPDLAFITGPVINKPDQKITFFSIGVVDEGGENPIYPTCNIFYRRDVFWQMGGFDESVNLGDVGTSPLECSDADLAWRIKEAGYVNRFVPELKVFHEVRQAAPKEWLGSHLRCALIPELLRRHAGLRSRLLWWGPFCLVDNLLFYVAIASAIAAVLIDGWFALAVLPFLVATLRMVWKNMSLSRLPKVPAQLAFLLLRQTLITGALIYGSIRARYLVI
jgi:glycosyltransferase involved in cell wall biosynthesis